MIHTNILVLFLFIAALSYSASYLLSETFAQSSLGCVDGNKDTNNLTELPNGRELPLLSPANSTMQDGFNNWKIISGLWNQTSSSLEGGTGNGSASPLENIIIYPNDLENISEIETTFKINEINPNLSNYVYIVYSYVDPGNFKIVGAHIFNDEIFVRFAEIANGCLTTEPYYVNTGLMWKPESTFNLGLSSIDGFQSLALNDTLYAGKSEPNIDGIAGLYYGRINDIDFYDYSIQGENSSNQSVESILTTDTQHIMLGDKSLPSTSYIHLYDSSPFGIIGAHISAKLPCDEDNNTNAQVWMGGINQGEVVDLESVDELSDSDNLCSYRADIISSEGRMVTDIVLTNNSTEDIEFPSTSSFTITVYELA
jgi:hypothetical protein